MALFVRRDLTDSVPTPEGNMHFVKKGAGYPVVLLHPLGTSVWTWEYVIDAISQNYTVYAFDMLGHGDSDKPKRHFNLPDYAHALDEACQVLNIHRAHYVGNSVGAVLATETAASFPDRVDKPDAGGRPGVERLHRQGTAGRHDGAVRRRWSAQAAHSPGT